MEKYRSTDEMLELIISIGERDENIRAISMEGSRVYSKLPADRFQDYDIVYYVLGVEPYIKNMEFIAEFGEIMILQMPEDKLYPPPQKDGSFIYLMKFSDGNRIDLTVANILKRKPDTNDKLLLDKDGKFNYDFVPNFAEFNVEKPSEKMYDDYCNEFWWMQLNICKGLARCELPYAKNMMNIIRAEFEQMIVWDIGIRNDFDISTGKMGKYIEKYLEPDEWLDFTKTYSSGKYDEVWDSVFLTCDMFRKSAQKIAQHFGFNYPLCDDTRVSEYMRNVRDGSFKLR